jgi:hypothetical protein
LQGVHQPLPFSCGATQSGRSSSLWKKDGWKCLQVFLFYIHNMDNQQAYIILSNWDFLRKEKRIGREKVPEKRVDEEEGGGMNDESGDCRRQRVYRNASNSRLAEEKI